MSKELGFCELLGDRAAVLTDEGLSAAPAQSMDGSGHELFPGAAFTSNQDRDIRIGNPEDCPEDSFHGPASADDLGECLVEFLAEAVFAVGHTRVFPGIERFLGGSFFLELVQQ